MLRFKELDDIVRMWENTNLLEGFSEKTPIALCLHAQVKLNEAVDLDPIFRRWSIPVLIRAFTESKAFKRNHFTNLFEGDKPNVAFLKTRFSPPRFNIEGPEYDPQQEAELISKLAATLREEIDYLFRDRKGATIIFHGISHSPDGGFMMLHYN